MCACGKLAGGANDAGLSEGAGAACRNAADADALKSPPACTSPDPDGGSNALCQQWADSVVNGATGYCNGGSCDFNIGKACTPGADGDAQCQAWLQSYSKTAYAYAKCWPRGDGPGAYGNQCVAADKCTDLGSSGYLCSCGADTTSTLGGGCDISQGLLCLSVGGTPTCTAWCQ